MLVHFSWVVLIVSHHHYLNSVHLLAQRPGPRVWVLHQARTGDHEHVLVRSSRQIAAISAQERWRYSS